jgi:D-inositol-3-phosphate glycosyltransferase
MRRAASVHAQSSGWQRTATITLESYPAAAEEFSAGRTVPAGYAPRLTG